MADLIIGGLCVGASVLLCLGWFVARVVIAVGRLNGKRPETWEGPR